jgi:hypothetical protein
VPNGVSLDFSHGMPMWAAILSTSSMQYVNSASCVDLGDALERSLIGKAISSSDSIMRPSAKLGIQHGTTICLRRDADLHFGLSGLLGLGIIDKGEVWKGPMVASSSALVGA